MRVSIPRLRNFEANINRGKPILRIAKWLAVFAVVVAVIWVLYSHFFKQNESTSSPQRTPASIKQTEDLAKDYNNSVLKDSNFETYQNSEGATAQLYLNYKDIKNAERVMVEIFQNVPSDKINTQTYELMAAVQKAKGDNAQYKHYLQIVVSRTEKEGDTQATSYYKNELSKL